MYKLLKKDLVKVFEQWSSTYTLLVPQSEAVGIEFAKWDGKEFDASTFRNTVTPPKNILFPLKEILFSFKKGTEGYQTSQPELENGKKIIFGVRACDARAFSVLDRNFTEGYRDTYYAARRDNTVVIGLSCTRPYDSCFCTSLGSSPNEVKNMDLMLTDTGEEFLIETVTTIGEAIITNLEYATQATEKETLKARESQDLAFQKVQRLNLKDIDKKLLANFENREYWEQVSAKCLNCGVCTFFCPTCFCFDINDEACRGEGIRSRCWDSCQFGVYTKMPMENPRGEKWRRVRQKVCHKFEFYPVSFRSEACTGCGRCIRLCPVNWDIRQVIASIPENIEVESK